MSPVTAKVGHVFVLRIPAYLNSCLQGLTGCTIVGRASSKGKLWDFASWKDHERAGKTWKILERLLLDAGCLNLLIAWGRVKCRATCVYAAPVQGTWQLTFTASHWQRIAGPVEEVGQGRTVAISEWELVIVQSIYVYTTTVVCRFYSLNASMLQPFRSTKRKVSRQFFCRSPPL